jgi:hypothetical protein
MAAHGLPAERFLTTDSNEERVVLVAVAQRAAELRDFMDQRLAHHIINTLAQAMRRG